MTKPVY